MKNTVNNTMTDRERKILVRAHQGYGLHYFEFIKVSKADDDKKLFYPIKDLYKAIKMEGLEETRETVVMGIYCVVLVSWKWREHWKIGGKLKQMYEEVNMTNLPTASEELINYI